MVEIIGRLRRGFFDRICINKKYKLKSLGSLYEHKEAVTTKGQVNTPNEKKPVLISVSPGFRMVTLAAFVNFNRFYLKRCWNTSADSTVGLVCVGWSVGRNSRCLCALWRTAEVKVAPERGEYCMNQAAVKYRALRQSSTGCILGEQVEQNLETSLTMGLF